MKNLIDSCKTKVKHISTSSQRRLNGFQWNTTCSLHHSIRKWIPYSLIFKKNIESLPAHVMESVTENQRIKSFFEFTPHLWLQCLKKMISRSLSHEIALGISLRWLSGPKHQDTYLNPNDSYWERTGVLLFERLIWTDLLFSAICFFIVNNC
jgi:hypothetical protein